MGSASSNLGGLHLAKMGSASRRYPLSTTESLPLQYLFIHTQADSGQHRRTRQKLETVDTHPDGCQARRRQALDDRDRADQIPSPHSPQRVCGRAGLVRCEECRWEGRKDIETIAPFVRADYQKKGISPHPIRTQHLRQFISSPAIRHDLSHRVLAGIKKAETRI
ncbi:hypothetical protein BLNAU_4138 [Blattamonas nauphoetae]|uniref:Uncharacterized protein n=1 Tax=Blattamonas nauphoetae TaxID=2049346 RepID=A0ABQ9YAI8_9EUKA|nr:hypothetical protein BLNAU_4138 [Blattamonas nauphoetae]